MVDNDIADVLELVALRSAMQAIKRDCKDKSIIMFIDKHLENNKWNIDSIRR